MLKKTVLLFLVSFFLFSGFVFSQHTVKPDTVLIDTTISVECELTLFQGRCVTAIGMTALYDTSQIKISNIQTYDVFDVNIVNNFPEGRLEIAFSQFETSEPICGADTLMLFTMDVYLKITDPRPGIIQITEKEARKNDDVITGRGRWNNWNFVTQFLNDFFINFKRR